MENRRCAIGFFVDQVDDAMTDRHRLLGLLKRVRLPEKSLSVPRLLAKTRYEVRFGSLLMVHMCFFTIYSDKTDQMADISPPLC